MRLSLSQTGPRLLSAVVFLTHQYADIPFAVCFGYAHCDVWILGIADIRPVSFAMMKAVCNTVGHTFRRAEPFSHPDGLSAVAFIITVIGHTVRSKVNILPIFKLGTDMLLGSMLKAD